MHQNQIALVPQQREDCALAARLPLHFHEHIGCFQGNVGALGVRKLLPRHPAHAQHLVQHAGAFQRQRNGRQMLSGDFRRVRNGRHKESLSLLSESS
jgi:hypothetical protein